MDMIITEHVIRHAVVTPTGRIDAFNTSALREKLDAMLAEGVKYFVLDLSQVQFLDSAGLAVFVSLLKRTRQEGGRIKMILPQAAAARRILRLTHFDRVFELVETVEAAFRGA